MGTTCGWCARAGFEECFCSKSDVETAWTVEKAHLQPLLERAQRAVWELNQIHPHSSLEKLLVDLQEAIGGKPSSMIHQKGGG